MHFVFNYAEAFNVRLQSSGQRAKRKTVSAFHFGFALILSILLFSTPNLSAQLNTADVVGTVSDSTGAVLVNATVTLKNINTGISRSGVSNSKGEYSFNLMQIGTYQITVGAKGFQKFVASNLKVSAGDRARVDAVMKIGEATESMEVSASEASALHTDSSTVSELISQQVVQEVPLNGRNLIDIVKLSAGVADQSANAFGGGTRAEDRRQNSAYAVNGQSDNANNNLIDGMDNNERLYGVLGVRPSVESVQEMKVMTNLYTAEAGRTAGGAVDVITKSGANSFHGSAFEFLGNDKFNSRTVAGQTKTPELRQNQFGASLGGPVIKNKTFFYGDFENLRLVAGLSDTAFVPSLIEQQSIASGQGADFSDLCSSSPAPTARLRTEAGPPPGPPGGGSPTADLCANGNNGHISASLLDPVGVNLFKLYPEPNYNVVGSSYNFISTPNKTQMSTTYDARIDHHISSADMVYGRYTINTITTVMPGTFPAKTIGSHTFNGVGDSNADGTSYQRAQQLGLDYVHIFRPNLLAEIKAGFLRYANNAMPLNGKDAATNLGFPCDQTSCINTAAGGASNGLPMFMFMGSSYAPLGDSTSLPLHNIDNSFQYLGSVTWNHGSHGIKAGIGVIRRQLLFQQAGAGTMGMYGSLGSVTGNPIQDLVLGASSTASRGTELVAQHLRTWEPSVYLQDDWRATSWLTLNLGVRYDIFTPYTEVNGYISNFSPVSYLIVSPFLTGSQKSDSTAGVKTDFGNIAPRVGFSASVRKDLVVRGGFGMTYFPPNSATAAALANAPFMMAYNCGAQPFATMACQGQYEGSVVLDGQSFSFAKISAGLPVPVFDLTLATNPANYSRINGVSTDAKSAYLEQWSLQMEKQLGPNVVTLGYVGNAGRRLPATININQPTTSANIYPIASEPGVMANLVESIGVSSYNAMQVLYSRRFNNGLSANMNYTWAHQLNDVATFGEGPVNYACVRYGCEVDNPWTGGTDIANGLRYDWGNGDSDARHRFNTMLSYQEPFGKNMRGVKGAVVKGWGLSGSGRWGTGTPFSVSNSRGLSGISGVMSDRPNMISNPMKAGNVTLPGGSTCVGPSKLGSPIGGVKYGFNPCAFAYQTAGTLGNERRNQLFGPHSWSMNAALAKDFPVTEKASISFRAEAFNVTNTHPDTTPGSSLGNDLTYAIESSGVQPGRQVQFDLKLKF